VREALRETIHPHSEQGEIDMNIERMNSIVSRILFIGAFLLLALAVLERISYEFGYTILRGSFTGGRLLEIAALILIFVIALLLRQIREALKGASTR
jgi:hypothetical protein